MSDRFKIGDTVKITVSEESGRVIAVLIHEEQGEQYLVRYKRADGVACEAWWTAKALTVVEAQ